MATFSTRVYAGLRSYDLTMFRGSMQLDATSDAGRWVGLS